MMSLIEKKIYGQKSFAFRHFLLIITLVLGFACEVPKTKLPPVTVPQTKLEAEPQHLSKIKTPENALYALVEGNKRFMNGQFEHAHIKRVTSSDDDTQPFVGIITCTDCKIPPEILFDLGHKFLMVFKSPANVVDEKTLTALNTAILKQSLKLVLILGHNNCRTIASFLQNKVQFSSDTSLLPGIPAISSRRDTLNEVDEAAQVNVKLGMQRLPAQSHLIDSLLKMHKLNIAGAYYNDKNGTVTFEQNL